MGNFIQITDGIAIKSDANNWEVCSPKKRKDKKTGEMVICWEGFSFHSTLDRAVKSLGEYLLRTGDSNSATELARAADTISELLSQKFTSDIKIQIKE